MEMTMKALTKSFLGAAMVAGVALATSAPANAQPDYRGDGYYGRSFDGYRDQGRYDDGRYGYGGMWRNTRYCTSPRFGQWRFNPVLQRRVFVPYRWAVRGGYLRNCMYTMNRDRW